MASIMDIIKNYEKLEKENKELQEKYDDLLGKYTKKDIELRQTYENIYQRKLEFEKNKYDTKVLRKKEILKLVKELEIYFYENIKLGINLSEYADFYFKLLEYLKEN